MPPDLVGNTRKRDAAAAVALIEANQCQARTALASFIWTDVTKPSMLPVVVNCADPVCGSAAPGRGAFALHP
jgi:hypothetical protein